MLPKYNVLCSDPFHFLPEFTTEVDAREASRHPPFTLL